MNTLFEIVELPNGEIALRRVDESGEPLLSIRFSKESLYFLNESKIDIAKAMIEAGLEAAGEIQETEESDEDEEFMLDGVDSDEYTLH